ncbi:MAG: amidohydrolase [Myxococcales bacterium]|nr:amidohydrolase [Myxococcales bacterium]
MWGRIRASIAWFSLIGVWYAAPSSALGSPRVVLIRNGHVITVSGAEIPHGDVLIVGRLIRRVGQRLRAPKGALIIDATGRFVTPGLIETHSHMGVHPIPTVGGRDTNESSHPIMPQVRVIDAVNISDPAIRLSWRGGITTIQVLPGSSNVIGGQSVVLKLRGGTVGSMLFREAPRGLKMALGENPKRNFNRRMPTSRMGAAYLLRLWFSRAKQYLAAWRHYDAQKGQSLRPPTRDLKLEVLADVLRGKLRVHVHTYRADEMLTMLRIADEFGFRIASFQHALEGYKIATTIAKRNVGVATFADKWGHKWEAQNATVRNAALLVRAGVVVAIHTDHPVIEQWWLIHEAAKAMKYGLSRVDAWRAVTINPAKILGVEKYVGSLEPGKHGDVVVWDRDPFRIGARTNWVLIEGRVVYEKK